MLRVSRQPGSKCCVLEKAPYSHITSIHWMLKLWTARATWQMPSGMLQWTSIPSRTVFLHERNWSLAPPPLSSFPCSPLPPEDCYVKKSGTCKFFEKFKLNPNSIFDYFLKINPKRYLDDLKIMGFCSEHPKWRTSPNFLPWSPLPSPGN